MVGLVGGAGVAGGVGWRRVVGFGLRLGEEGLFAVGHFGIVPFWVGWEVGWW